MKYQVIARKFRPQVFEDVVGQGPIVQTLRNAIHMDRIGHAYLFCGPRGVGKTTTARLLAKALNCVEGPTAEPCNKCPSCQEISAGRSIDVLEIDAASNTGVDSIRELRENARYAPSRDRNKIFIVDEVHMLSTSAFNALLKILEEPPPHVAFIMATTERHKLPATILSRCQQFVFRTIPPSEILEHLKKIAQRESIEVGEGALEYVVKAAEGSMRDAQSLLDQIIAFGGQEIADDDVRDVLGFIPADILDRTTEALIARDSKTLLDVVEIVVDQGLNLQQFVREFLARVRDLLLAKLNITEKILAAPDERSRIVTQAESFSEQDLVRFFDMLLRLENDLRWASEPRFHLEVGCIKLAKVGHLRDIEEVIRELKSGPEAGADPPPVSKPKPSRPARPVNTESEPARLSLQTPGPAAGREEPPASPPPGASPEKPSTGPALSPSEEKRTEEHDVGFEARFRNKVREESEKTSLYLERVKSIHQAGPRLEIKVSTQTVKKALETKERRQVLERAAGELLGKAISVSLIMEQVSNHAEETSADAALRSSAESETLVQSFLDVFRGEIAQVKSAKDPSEE